MVALTKSQEAQEDSVDDGWQMPTPEDKMMTLIREALFILDGEVPDEIVCSGDGWSLLDPAAARRPAPAAPKRSFLAIVHEALDEALADGWCLAQDD